MIKIAILAGGLATRLLPITETIPKALVKIAGKPFILHQLNYLKHQGINQIVLCIGHLGHKIRELVGNGENFGLQVVYSEDGPGLLGTGGAIMKALPKLGKQFFIIYGDSFLPIDFLKVYQAFSTSKKQALMTVLRNNDQWDKSNVIFTNGELIEYNKFRPSPKMSYIDYGLSVIDSSVLKKDIKKKSFDLAETFQDLSFDGHLAGFEVYERFYEIGSQNGFKETENYFLTKEKA